MKNYLWRLLMTTIFVTLNLAISGCGGTATPSVAVLSTTVTPAPVEPLAPTAPVAPTPTIAPIKEPDPIVIPPPVDTPPLDPPPPIEEAPALVPPPQIEQAAPAVEQPANAITIGFLPTAKMYVPGKNERGTYDIAGFVLTIGGDRTQFLLQNIDFAGINLATTNEALERMWQMAILGAYNPVSPNHATLESLGFTLVQTPDAYRLTAPAGAALTGGEWFFSSITQGAEPVIQDAA